MKYWQGILLRNIEWNWKRGYSMWHVVKTLIFRKRYKAWLDREIVRIYRANTENPLAFSRSFEGLPKLTDKIKDEYSSSTIDYRLT